MPTAISNSTNLEWLIINSIYPLIAHPIQGNLLRYLSTFATIFLFDDQVLIAQDAIKQLTKTSSTDNHRIHLFSLQGHYYPLSFILQLTYDDLSNYF